MPLGQIPPTKLSKPANKLKFAAKLPLRIVTIVASAIISWLAFWFIFRLGQFLYDHFLDHPW